MSDKPKFTPGPWPDLIRVDVGDTARRIAMKVRYEGRIVAAPSMAEIEANARLIAAAPELYAALETAIEGMQVALRCSAQHGWERDEAQAAIETARAALAKARGE